MSDIRGFTLIEIIAALIIVVILAMYAITNYTAVMTKQAAIAARNNLISIYNAEKNFHLTNVAGVGAGSPSWYCTNSNQRPACATTLANINLAANLNLNITDNNFTYACTGPANGSTFTCIATNIADGAFTMTLTNNPIVLAGGVGAVNPSCTYAAHLEYCPN